MSDVTFGISFVAFGFALLSLAATITFWRQRRHIQELLRDQNQLVIKNTYLRDQIANLENRLVRVVRAQWPRT